MSEILNWIQENAVQLVAIVGGGSMICSSIAAITKTPKDDVWGGWLKRLYTLLVDIPALNVGKAKAVGKPGLDGQIKEMAGGLLGGLFKKLTKR